MGTTSMTDEMCPICKHHRIRMEESKSSSNKKGSDFQCVCTDCGLRTPYRDTYDKAIKLIRNIRIGEN